MCQAAGVTRADVRAFRRKTVEFCLREGRASLSHCSYHVSTEITPAFSPVDAPARCFSRVVTINMSTQSAPASFALMRRSESSKRNLSNKSVIFLAAFAFVCCRSVDAQTTNWNGTTGNWSDITKWDNGVPNSNTSIAQFLAGASPFTTTVNGAFSLNQLILNNANATVSITSGNSLTFGGASPSATLTAGTVSNAGTINGGAWTLGAGNLSMNGGSFVGGSIAGTGTGRIDASSSLSNVLSGVALSGNAIGVTSGGGWLGLTNGTTFASGSIASLTGTNSDLRWDQNNDIDNVTVNFGVAGAGVQLYGGRSISIAAGGALNAQNTSGNTWLGASLNPVHTNSGVNNLTVFGTVSQTGPSTGAFHVNPSGTLTIGSGGTIQATAGGLLLIESTGNFTIGSGGILRGTNGSTVTIASTGTWTNAGTIDVNASTLNLNRSFNATDIGTITRTGGTINIGSTLTNNIASLDVQTVFSGDVRLNSGSIVGGALTTSGVGKLDASTNVLNVLNGVALSGSVINLSTTSSWLGLTNGSAFASGSVATLSGTNSELRWDQNNSIDNLTLNLTGPGGSGLQLFGGRTVTLAATTSVVSTNVSGNAWLGASLPHSSSGTNNLTILGTVTHSGNSSTTFHLNPSGTLTIGNGGLVQATVANSNLIVESGGNFTINAGGILRATGGSNVTVAPTGTWSNAGTMDVNASTLNLNRAFNATDIGTITRTAGTITIGAALTNNIASLDIQTIFKGDVRLSGGSIIGGSLTTSGAGKLDASNAVANVLNGVAVSGNTINVQQTVGWLGVTNGTTFSSGSVLTLSGTNSELRWDQNNDIDNVTINLNGSGGSGVQIFGGRTVTLGSTTSLTSANVSGNTWLGATLSHSNSGTNNLTILGTATHAGGASTNFHLNPSGTLTIGSGGLVQGNSGTTTVESVGLFTNGPGGTLRANAGATVTVTTAGATNTGTFDVNGGTMNLNSTGWKNFNGVTAGLINVTSGTLNLGGTFNGADLGNWNHTGGTVNVTGAMTINPTDTVTLDNAKGNWVLTAGSISGGNFTTTGTNRIQANFSSSNTLNGVNYSGKIDLTAGNSFLRVIGGTTFVPGSTIDMATPTVANAQLRVGQSSIDNVTVTATSGVSSVLSFLTAEGTSGTVTLGSNFQFINNYFARVTSNLDGGSLSGFIDNGLLQSNANTMTINPTAPFTVGSTGTLQASGGTIFVANATTLTNFSGTTLTGGTYRVSGGGTLNLDSTRPSITTLGAGTTVELNGTSTFTAINQLATNGGTFRLLGGRAFTTVGSFANNGLLEISGAGSTFTMAGAAFTNSGTVNVLSGGAFNSGASVTVSSGQFTIGTGGTVGGAGSFTVQNSAVLRVDGALNKVLTVDAGGRVQGTGTINGNVTLDGEIAPGNSAGTITVNGSITQKGSTVTKIEIGGTTQGTQYDNIIVTQTVTLNGQLNVSFFGGYLPTFNDNFVILQAGSILGQWSNTPNNQYFGGFFTMDVLYTPTFVSLSGFSPVPEPGGLALVAAGAAACLIFGTGGHRLRRILA